MKKDILRFLRDRHEIKFNRKIFIFIVCLIIATLAWLQINLSKDQVETLPVKVDFVNLPKSRFGVTEISDTLMVEVESDGYGLLKYKMEEVVIEFKKLKKDVNTGGFYFLPNNYTKTISNQMSENYKVVRVVVDTVQLKPHLR